MLEKLVSYLVETREHLYDYFLFPDNDICNTFNLNDQLNNQNNNWLILLFDMLFDLLSWQGIYVGQVILTQNSYANFRKPFETNFFFINLSLFFFSQKGRSKVYYLFIFYIAWSIESATNFDWNLSIGSAI